MWGDVQQRAAITETQFEVTVEVTKFDFIFLALQLSKRRKPQLKFVNFSFLYSSIIVNNT